MATVKASKKDAELNPRQIRAKGLTPVTIYGKGEESVSAQLNAKEFMIDYKKNKNAVFDIETEEKTYKTIVKNVQTESISGKVLNIEFQRISNERKIKITVPIEVVGASPAIKAGGNLVLNLSKIEAECLPADIPVSIKADISVLVNFGETLSVNQIAFPEGVQPMGSLENIVVKINTPRAAKAK